MAELFLAIVAYDAQETELDCAVALGSENRRSHVPMPLADCLQVWRVPNAFSVCTIAILGETGLGKVSVPIMSLGKQKNVTLDEWYPVDPSDLSTHARLRLLLHLRQGEGEGGEASGVPKSFEQLCHQLLPAQEPLQSSPPEPSPKSPSPAEAEGAAAAKEDVTDEDFASDLQELHRLCQSMLSARPETPQPPRGPSDDPESPSADDDAANVYDEALAQLLAQKEALERESTELNTHWTALQADQSMKHEVLAEMRAERLSILSTVEELQAEVLDTTAELKEAQASASGRLATRRRLQAELTACAQDFGEEASAQRGASQALRAQRAQLRSEAVELGKTLQLCVSRGDELVSENLRLRTESSDLEEAEERSASELQSFMACQPQLLRHCRQLWQKGQLSQDENGSAPRLAGNSVESRKGHTSSEGHYPSRIDALRKAADRIACPNGMPESAAKQ